MNSPQRRFEKRRSNLVRLGVFGCAVLGVLWALSPILHGVFHLAEVPHRHPSGSVHSHDHAVHSHGHASHGHSHGHSHTHHDGSAHEGHSHDEHENADGDSQDSGATSSDTPSGDNDNGDQENGDQENGDQENGDQENGERESDSPVDRPDDGSGGLFLTLDVTSSSSIGIAVVLSEFSLPLELVVSENTEVFSATLIGASGPRGPPV